MKESGRRLKINFGKEAMKVLVDNVTKVHPIKTRIYEVRVGCTDISIYALGKKNSFLPSAMKFGEDEEFSKDASFHAGKFIW